MFLLVQLKMRLDGRDFGGVACDRLTQVASVFLDLADVFGVVLHVLGQPAIHEERDRYGGEKRRPEPIAPQSIECMADDSRGYGDDFRMNVRLLKTAGFCACSSHVNREAREGTREPGTLPSLDGGWAS